MFADKLKSVNTTPDQFLQTPQRESGLKRVHTEMHVERPESALASLVCRPTLRYYRPSAKQDYGPRLRQDKEINELLNRISRMPTDNRPPLVEHSILQEKKNKNNIFSREVSFVQALAEAGYVDDYSMLKMPSPLRTIASVPEHTRNKSSELNTSGRESKRKETTI